jgi:hypothetical protein
MSPSDSRNKFRKSQEDSDECQFSGNINLINEFDNIVKTNNINSIIEKKRLNIKCADYTENECYNDYMIMLEHPVKVMNLNLNNINLPKRDEENITIYNNKLSVDYNNDIKILELEPNYYNRYEIVNFLNEGFIANNISIKCYISENDKFTFISENKFILNNGDDSILPYLGFNKTVYMNKNKYEAENYIDIGDNIFYLAIENISNEPLFLINNDDNIIEKIKDIDEEIEIDHLIIKFMKTKYNIIKNNSQYSFFFENEHDFQFELQ